MSVRKAHNNGRNHLRNVIDYYQRMPPTLLPSPKKSYPHSLLWKTNSIQKSPKKKPNP